MALLHMSANSACNKVFATASRREFFGDFRRIVSSMGITSPLYPKDDDPISSPLATQSSYFSPKACSLFYILVGDRPEAIDGGIACRKPVGDHGGEPVPAKVWMAYPPIICACVRGSNSVALLYVSRGEFELEA